MFPPDNCMPFSEELGRDYLKGSYHIRQTTEIITQNQTIFSTFYVTARRAICAQSSCTEYHVSATETQNLQHSNWQGA